MHYAGLYIDGIKSQDSLRIAGLEVKGQMFAEATKLRSSPLYWEDKMDSVLGLASLPMNRPESDVNASSPFQNIVDQKLLDRNIFSLKLSRSPQCDGELLFGDVNADLYQGDLVSIPISHTTHDELPRTGWQVDAHSLTFGSGSEVIDASLSGYTAIFLTAYPWIMLPNFLAEQLLERCGGDPDFADMIDCEKRDSLPDLTIRLGQTGHAVIVLTPWDYVMEVPAEGGGTTCLIPFKGHKERRGEPKYIFLGSAFLSGLYSVFDYDQQTISRKFFPRTCS